MNNTMKPEMEHPGIYIREEIEERGWSQVDLAYILNCPVQSINLIISGRRGISADMARSLSVAFDVSAELFVNLQRMYDLSRAGDPDEGIIKRAQFFQKSYPLREMIKREWIEDTDPALLEAQMCRFFEVSKIEEMPQFVKHAARRTHYDSIPSSQLAWLFRVRQIAKSVKVPPYSEKRLIDALPKLKRLMSEPEEARHVPRIMIECGIRYVVAEILPGSKIDGVCFWLDPKSPVIGMSVRFDRIDNFWFVLRHEIEHVLQKHGQTKAIIDIEIQRKDPRMSEEERIANKVATNFCVSIEKLDSLIARKLPYISKRDLLGFSASIGVHPGIVAGQLHFKTDNYTKFNKFIVKIREHLLQDSLTDGWGNVAPINL